MTDANASADARWRVLQEALRPAREADVSNSRLRDTSVAQGNPLSGTYEAGIDTARFLYRLHDRRQQRRAEELHTRPTPLAGAMHFGYSPGYEQIWVEGRPATVVFDELDGDRRLLPPSRLEDASELIGMALDGEGYTAHAIRPSRLDHTATVRFDRPAEGWAFLRGMYALDVPRRKPALYGRPPETVYWLTEKSGEKNERAYDKGHELGTGQRGLTVRLETRVRPKGDDRTAVQHWTPERVRQTFLGRFGAMAKSAQGLHVGSEQYLREQLRDFSERGRITPRMAELLMGHISAEAVGLRRNVRARQRRRAELRRLGLAHALDGASDDAQALDLGAVLDDVLSSPHWDA